MSSDDAAPTGIARSTTAVLAANIAAGLIAVVFAVTVARSLGPAGRGIVAFATTVTMTASWLSLLGLDAAFGYFCGARRELRTAMVSSAVVAGLGTGLLGCVVGWAVFSVFPDLVPPGATRVMVLAALITTPLLSIQRLFNVTLISTGRIGLANAVVVSIPIVALTLFLTIGALVGRSAMVAVVAWVASRAFGAAASIVLGGRAIGFGDVATTREALRLSLGYGVRAYAGSIASQPIRRLDTFVLAAVAPAPQLGLYAAAVNVSEVGMYLPNAVASVLLPASAGMSDEKAARVVHRAAAVVMTLVVLGAALGIVLARPMVTLILGDSFAGAVGPLQLMFVAMIGAAARRTFGSGLMAMNRAGVVSWITVGTMVVIIALDLFLIPRYGASGAAAASMIAYCVGGAGAFVAYRSSLRPEIRRALPSLRTEFTAGLAEVRARVRARHDRPTLRPAEASTSPAVHDRPTAES